MKYSYDALKPKITYFNTNWNGAVNKPDSTKSIDSNAINKQIPSVSLQPPGGPPLPANSIPVPIKEQKK